MCPAPAGSRLGNRITAIRWEAMLGELGHRAEIVGDATGEWDVLVALHASKSADAIFDARARRPRAPIVLALTGTDLYRDILRDERARRTLDLADRIVVLHDLAPLDVPAEARAKVHVVRQSAVAARGGPRSRERFEIAFVAHARPEKDPLRPALAVRALPASSRAVVLHAGRALGEDLGAALRREAAENARYEWLGEIRPEEALELIARASVLVLPSEMEGGANVLGEAIVAGTPPIASRIPACVAALGADYEGLFPVFDTAALTALLHRAETDPAFHERLVAQTNARRDLFSPAAEREAWREVLAALF